MRGLGRERANGVMRVQLEGSSQANGERIAGSHEAGPALGLRAAVREGMPQRGPHGRRTDEACIRIDDDDGEDDDDRQTKHRAERGAIFRSRDAGPGRAKAVGRW